MISEITPPHARAIDPGSETASEATTPPKRSPEWEQLAALEHQRREQDAQLSLVQDALGSAGMLPISEDVFDVIDELTEPIASAAPTPPISGFRC